MEIVGDPTSLLLLRADHRRDQTGQFALACLEVERQPLAKSALFLRRQKSRELIRRDLDRLTILVIDREGKA
ncbi:hypothetical protein D3C87_1759960 [compost metagenome]